MAAAPFVVVASRHPHSRRRQDHCCLGLVLLSSRFGVHTFKLERYREDQHGPCTVSSCLAWMARTNRELQFRLVWRLGHFSVSCLDDTQKSRSVNQIRMAPSGFVVIASRHHQSCRCRRRHHDWDHWAHSYCRIPSGVLGSNWNDTVKSSMAPAQLLCVSLG